jgi:hypothetical protein
VPEARGEGAGPDQANSVPQLGRARHGVPRAPDAESTEEMVVTAKLERARPDPRHQRSLLNLAGENVARASVR